MLKFCTKKSQKSQFSKFFKALLNQFIKNPSSSFVTTDQIRRFPASEVHYHAHYMLKTLHKFILLREPLATTNLWYVISSFYLSNSLKWYPFSKSSWKMLKLSYLRLLRSSNLSKVIAISKSDVKMQKNAIFKFGIGKKSGPTFWNRQ